MTGTPTPAIQWQVSTNGGASFQTPVPVTKSPTFGMLAVGHSPPNVVKAISDQAARYVHLCALVGTMEPYVRLAEILPLALVPTEQAEVAAAAAAVVVAATLAAARAVLDVMPEFELVAEVASGSAAHKAGFKAGDVIVKINGASVRDIGDVHQELDEARDTTAKVDIIRKGKPMTLSISRR